MKKSSVLDAYLVNELCVHSIEFRVILMTG
jgi:hypothetical protein